jgi:Protein of unknown function (DUF3144)
MVSLITVGHWSNMSKDSDTTFYDRADEHINLSNSQLETVKSRGRVNASMMYASARFCAWASTARHSSAEDLREGREEMIGYFINQFREMLEANFDDYIKNFDKYSETNR